MPFISLVRHCSLCQVMSDSTWPGRYIWRLPILKFILIRVLTRKNKNQNYTDGYKASLIFLTTVSWMTKYVHWSLPLYHPDQETNQTRSISLRPCTHQLLDRGWHVCNHVSFFIFVASSFGRTPFITKPMSYVEILSVSITVFSFNYLNYFQFEFFLII